MVNRPYGDLDPLDIEDEGVEVFHETGLTPRQLVVQLAAADAHAQKLFDQRAELLEAAEAMMARWPADQHEDSPRYREANAMRAAIAKAKGDQS